MQQTTITGTGVALVTPFKKDDSIDTGALRNIVEHVIGNGVDFLVVLGTTGEPPTLTDAEKKDLVNRVKEYAAGRVPVVVGMGSNHTKALVEKLRTTDFDGIDAILSVSPYYNKPTQQGIYRHFMTVAESSPVPVIIYNVPSRTGSNILAETTLRLASDSSNFAGIKEASGDLAQIMKIVHGKPDGFQVISGDDVMTLPIIGVGGTGVISVAANAFPRQISEMVRLSMSGHLEEARSIHYSLLEIIENLFVEGNPAGVKAALNILEICEKHVRMPLVPVSKTNYARLSELIKSIPV